MIETTANLGLLFLSCILLSVLYWQIVYPVIIRRLRFQLFEIRDSLRLIGSDTGVGRSKAYIELEGFVCTTIRVVPAISIISFLWFCFANNDRLKNEMTPKREGEPTGFEYIRTSTARVALLMMALNSPWMVFLSGSCAFMCFALGRITRLQLYRDTEIFVERIPHDSSSHLQMA